LFVLNVYIIVRLLVVISQTSQNVNEYISVPLTEIYSVTTVKKIL